MFNYLRDLCKSCLNGINEDKYEWEAGRRKRERECVCV